jgi:hypothetical protein
MLARSPDLPRFAAKVSLASWTRTPGSASRLIGHPLSLHILFARVRPTLPVLCPSPEPANNGWRALHCAPPVPIEWDGMRERMSF